MKVLEMRDRREMERRRDERDEMRHRQAMPARQSSPTHCHPSASTPTPTALRDPPGQHRSPSRSLLYRGGRGEGNERNVRGRGRHEMR